jgi:hypothetical protein
MTAPPLPDEERARIAAIAEGLSVAQREIVLRLDERPIATHHLAKRFCAVEVRTTDRARAVCQQLRNKGLAEHAMGRFWWRLTPLGLAVRAYLKEPTS